MTSNVTFNDQYSGVGGCYVINAHGQRVPARDGFGIRDEAQQPTAHDLFDGSDHALIPDEADAPTESPATDTPTDTLNTDKE